MSKEKEVVTKAEQPEFGKIRAALWPIHGHEMKKFLPMGLMMFFILYNYTILRSLKDVLITTDYWGEAALFPPLKLFLVLPSSILFVVLYAKLVNVFKRETVFYLIAGIFMTFFALFAFVIYPNNAAFLPDPDAVKAMQAAHPSIQHLIGIYGVWTDALFYMFSELWGSIMLSLLFWQFANEITRSQEAKRFYGLFGLLGNVALLFSGVILKWSSAAQEAAGGGQDVFTHSLIYTVGSVLAGSALVMFLYRWMQTNVLTDPHYYVAAETSGSDKKQKKPKLSVSESFKYLVSSKYVGYIALLVLAYGISMNLIEVGWKQILKVQFPEKLAMQDFYGSLQLYLGFATMVAILFFKGIVRRLGWYVGAMLTPVMMLVTGGIFFALALFGNMADPLAAALGITSLSMAVYFGLAQNVLSKSTKYSLFDPTKEMAYIPLDQELKTKGKAAVDVIGGRLGKAGGAAITFILGAITGIQGLLELMPYLAVFAIIMILIWMFAVSRLNGLYQAAVKKEEQEEAQFDEKLKKADEKASK